MRYLHNFKDYHIVSDQSKVLVFFFYLSKSRSIIFMADFIPDTVMVG